MIGLIPYEFARNGVSAIEYGFWFSLTPFGYLLGNILTRRLVKTSGIERLILLGSLLGLLSLLPLYAVDPLSLQHPLWITFPCMIYGISSGLVIGNASMGAVNAAGKYAGSASGMLGAFQMGFGVLGGTMLSMVSGLENFSAGVSILVLFSLVSLCASKLVERH